MTAETNITLYNKYRPHKFRDVIGQEHITTGLREAVLNNHVSHAYLLVGTRGTGKTTTARILAAAVNCMQLEPDGEPCGECDACIQSFGDGWPGVLHEMDAASNRGVGDIQNLISHVSLGTTANYKVYIIDEVHLLTREAAAALLKTLEEPPRGVLFILATTDPQKLLDTIRSRSSELRFKNIGRPNLRKIVDDIIEKENLELDKEIVEQVIIEGNGSARDTISKLNVANMGALDSSITMFSHISSRLAEKDISGLFLAVHKLDQDGNLEPQRVAEKLVEVYESALLYQQDPDLPLSCSKETLPHVKQIAKDNTQARLVRNIRSVAESMSLMKVSTNNKAILETALAQLVSPTARAATDSIMDAIDDLFVRLEGIESAISQFRSDSAGPVLASTAPAPVEWDLGASDDKAKEAQEEEEPEKEKPKKGRKKPEPDPEPDPEPESGSGDDLSDDDLPEWEQDPEGFLSSLVDEFRGRVSAILSQSNLVVENGVPVIVSDAKITSKAREKIDDKFGVECEYRSS